jgi:hypothetical protein
MGLTSVDPLVNRFDLSDDPIAWAKSRTILCDTLMKNLKTWAVKGNEPNYYLRGIFMTVLSHKTQDMMYVSRLVGGQSYNRNRSGDPDAKPALQLTDPKRQRDALNMLSETVFKDEFFATEAELWNDLAPSRWMDWYSERYSRPVARVDFPVHETIGSMQGFALLGLCSPQVLQRIYDAELKSKSEDKFTAAELISRVKTSIWGNLTMPDDVKFSDAKPMLSSTRRNLQRQHVQYLLAIAESKPGQLVSADLQSMVSFALKDLSDQINTTLAQANRLDFATRAHLTQTKSQIDRVLNAPYIQMPQMNSAIIILGQPTGQQ